MALAGPISRKPRSYSCGVDPCEARRCPKWSQLLLGEMCRTTCRWSPTEGAAMCNLKHHLYKGLFPTLVFQVLVTSRWKALCFGVACFFRTCLLLKSILYSLLVGKIHSTTFCKTVLGCILATRFVLIAVLERDIHVDLKARNKLTQKLGMDIQVAYVHTKQFKCRANLHHRSS